MSVDSFFFVRDENLPTISQWQVAFDQAEIDIVLENVGDLRTHTGYLPATYHGNPSGFEWYFGSLAVTFGGDLPQNLSGREYVIDCVTHSDIQEWICGMTACSVFSRLVDGVFFDEESGQLISADAALEMVQGLESKCND